MSLRCDRRDCFGNENGRCGILSQVYKDNGLCPFHKSQDEYMKQRAAFEKGDTSFSRKFLRSYEAWLHGDRH